MLFPPNGLCGFIFLLNNNSLLNELLTLAFSKLGSMVSTGISFVKNVGGQFHDQKSFGRGRSGEQSSGSSLEREVSMVTEKAVPKLGLV